MANDSEIPKFPPPIPNPLAQSTSSAKAKPKATPIPIQEDDKTDPDLAITLERTLERTAEIATEKKIPDKPAPAKLLNTKMPELGSLDALMKDPEITEIMVNDLRNVMIEKKGKLMYSGITYQAIDELNRLTRNILDITGRILSPDSPYVDTMLPDGSRVNIVGPPLTLYGPCITIRKFPEKRLTVQELIAAGSFDHRIGQILQACVMGKLNVLISGGTGSGKTTLLNVLISFIPKQERIITIEDTPELIVDHSNSVKLQIKPQTPGSAPITARELVANSLRMRPDRVLVGECRRSEAFDMLQVMNTGHSGSMTTIHANSPRDGLSRLETLCMMAGSDLPLLAIRRQVASAIDLVIQIKRTRTGTRKIVNISEITGMEGEVITLQDIFTAENETLMPTGLVPTFMDRLREQGIEIPHSFFQS